MVLLHTHSAADVRISNPARSSKCIRFLRRPVVKVLKVLTSPNKAREELLVKVSSVVGREFFLLRGSYAPDCHCPRSGLLGPSFDHSMSMWVDVDCITRGSPRVDGQGRPGSMWIDNCTYFWYHGFLIKKTIE